MNRVHVTVNKYGNTVVLPPTEGNAGVRRITTELDKMHVRYQTEFAFAGQPSRKFDIALFETVDAAMPCLLIEYDGEPHYDTSYYAHTGTRPERTLAHVITAQLSDAAKIKLAHQFNVPIVRMNKEHLKHIYEIMVCYVTVFVDNANVTGKEEAIIDAFEKYGWSFKYVPKSKMTKRAQARYEKMLEDHKVEE